jgi:hypothetical protein
MGLSPSPRRFWDRLQELWRYSVLLAEFATAYGYVVVARRRESQPFLKNCQLVCCAWGPFWALRNRAREKTGWGGRLGDGARRWLAWASHFPIF